MITAPGVQKVPKTKIFSFLFFSWWRNSKSRAEWKNWNRDKGNKNFSEHDLQFVAVR
jgi:hypothetical protein